MTNFEYGACKAATLRVGTLRSAYAIALAATFMLAGAGGARPEFIEDSLADAYRTNPQLAAGRAQLRAIDETVPQALANWRPTVTLSGNVGRAHDDIRNKNQNTGVVTTTKQDRNPGSANFVVSQPLYRGGRTTAQISQAENTVQQNRAVLVTTEQTVLLDTATAYMNLVRDLAVLQLNRNNEQNLTRQLAATRDRFQVGDVTRTDVAQAESALANATAGRTQAEGNVTASRATYVRAVGHEAGALQPAKPLTNLPVSAAAAVIAAANAPSVIAARFAAAAARNTIDVLAGQKLPTLSLQGDIQRAFETGTAIGQRRDTFDILAVLSVPLYQAGLPDAQTRAAKQTAGQLRIAIDDVLHRAQEGATQAWQQLNTARSRVSSFEVQVRASTIALDGVLQEARVGSRTVLDTLNAQQDLLNAQTNLVTSQRDEIVNSYLLKSAIGKLTAQELGLAVEVYDPTVYYQQARRRWIGTSIPEEFDAMARR